MKQASRTARIAAALVLICLLTINHGAPARAGTAIPITFSFNACDTTGGGSATCNRTFRIYVPSSYTGNETGGVPLHISLHGNGMSADEMEAGTYGDNTVEWGMDGRYDQLAEAQDFIVIYGQGSSGGPSGGYKWNDCREPSEATANDVNTNADDVAYIKSVLDYVTTNFAINKNRIYVSGYSNGGLMAMRLYGANGTTALGYTIRAFATFAANLPTGSNHGNTGFATSDCPAEPTVKRPMLMMFGQADGIMCYTGGYVGTGSANGSLCSTRSGSHGWVRSAADTVTYFKTFLGTTTSASADIHDSCNGTNPKSCKDGTTILTSAGTPPGGKYTYTNPADANDTAIEYRITGGGHTVPGTLAITYLTRLMIGYKNMDFQTFTNGVSDHVGGADEIVNFFDNYN